MKKIEIFWIPFIALLYALTSAVSAMPAHAETFNKSYDANRIEITAAEHEKLQSQFLSQSTQQGQISIDLFSQLTETDVNKIKDPDLLKYVNDARAKIQSGQKGETVPLKEFHVFFEYNSEDKDELRKRAEALGITDIYFYKYSDLISISTDADKLLNLLHSNSSVISVETDEIANLSSMTLGNDTETITKISKAHQKGLNGNGAYVAILDTGLNSSNPEFGGRVYYEHCYTSTYFYDSVNNRYFYPSCTDGTTESNSAYPYHYGYSRVFNHGSHVAGISAGEGGIAPEANIIALQVFSLVEYYDPDDGNWYVSTTCFFSDLYRALEFIIDLRSSGVNIIAANMSLGGSLYNSYCDSQYSSFKFYFDQMRFLGIIPVVASGNSYSDGLVSVPGCISSAYTIGSVWNSSGTPVVSSFSNHAEMVDLMAPGEYIYSSLLDGTYGYMSGTSMATPMVTGALAALSGKTPAFTGVSNLERSLQTHSTSFVSRAGINKKVLNFKNIFSSLFDFNRDGLTDVSVFRPSNGLWAINNVGFFYYGMNGDIPVPGDYNGDGFWDLAIFRPSNGLWAINGVGHFIYGTAGDIPVPKDYNGDGFTDIAIFRPSNGLWAINGIGHFIYGMNGDIPVPEDYNGDGYTDLAIYRPSNSLWAINGVGQFIYGTSGDIPVPEDYNGDGFTDIAIFRPSNGLWAINGVGHFIYGMNGDVPVPGDYNGDGYGDIAIFRPSNGLWAINGVGSLVYGIQRDVPITRSPSFMNANF